MMDITDIKDLKNTEIHMTIESVGDYPCIMERDGACYNGDGLKHEQFAIRLKFPDGRVETSGIFHSVDDAAIVYEAIVFMFSMLGIKSIRDENIGQQAA